MTRGLLLAALLLVAGCRERSVTVSTERPTLSDPGRVVVEVLNAAGSAPPRRGLARIGARHLRELGLDVVAYGTADTVVDSSLVLVRRGDESVGRQVAAVLGGAEVLVRTDSLLRVDVTVLLGRRWTPGPDPRP